MLSLLIYTDSVPVMSVKSKRELVEILKRLLEGQRDSVLGEMRLILMETRRTSTTLFLDQLSQVNDTDQIRRTSSPVGIPSTAPAADVVAQGNDLEINSREGSVRSEAGILEDGAGLDQFGVINDEVVREEESIEEGDDPPEAANAPSVAADNEPAPFYDYRKCLVAKKEA
ncbi:hypothetical protein CAEBREN_08769 [Caenorhabditis brenneri]|uniref:Uncharacterized protein n=1 Tax=Caenorhabditis brenneri TaxID=135651 RepID=G0P2Z8_CAEBE|nr:hypothetical protein CAEBREN_08769 [Caenorhabditis brenneri]